ncbi:hypothetical protein COCC4DRAFT_32308 [Bipolaris maydis ATCC 48331]|uniref:Uncharacterized protein n=2 Tax=Cochliobolus heterostrophus TaxID=5016 RepID=M2UH99_COCH5|nr:uncharacterized protein COCC4DRAFT_32308 [Bipolaris maydis ATCC 48331]EMD93071.1 hypothetical protein COCHEDRAFT_1020877 [Bipolaris maydis C5]ENI04540.1 hypothetical protein COCC4DRAFT_32308 [Bipolaris maydis ATCC 48331]KAJ6208095.1 hypothetical protein PSV09DRAFT_1020877 [Bipolaris maydis]
MLAPSSRSDIMGNGAFPIVSCALYLCLLSKHSHGESDTAKRTSRGILQRLPLDSGYLERKMCKG